MFNVGDFRILKKDVYVHSLSLDLRVSFANDIIVKIIEVSHKIFNGDTFVFGEVKELLYPFPGAKTQIVNKPNSVIGFYISESEPFDVPYSYKLPQLKVHIAYNPDNDAVGLLLADPTIGVYFDEDVAIKAVKDKMTDEWWDESGREPSEFVSTHIVE